MFFFSFAKTAYVETEALIREACYRDLTVTFAPDPQAGIPGSGVLVTVEGPDSGTTRRMAEWVGGWLASGRAPTVSRLHD